MIKKILLIEDGSLDISNIEFIEQLSRQGIGILTYRQGANKPEVIDFRRPIRKQCKRNRLL